MSTANLNATPRSETGKGAARKLRRAQQIPGIVYGHRREPQPLALDMRELERLLDQVAPETTVVELRVDGSTTRTLIREIQRHPFRREILHIDFQELVAGELVTVDVPIVLHGTPAGVRAGGTLDLVLREITVEVDPGNIPNHIDVDVAGLEVGDSLHVRDLNLPAGATVLDEPDATVCVVAAPRVETEAVAAEAPAEGAETSGEPEVIRKAKEGEEGEEK